MGVFTLTINQLQIGKKLYLYPNANGCNTDFTPVGEANNWQCVDDPVTVPADDTTYVYHETPSVSYDMYSLPNHTVEAGTINYVQVFARGKSHLYTPHPDSVYKILLSENACSNIYKSDNISLMSEYATYNELWTTNPRTTAAWTWEDIDNLQIGSECSSVTIEGADRTLVLRPTGAGDDTEFTIYGDPPTCAANWQCVDDIAPDAFDTCLYIIYPGSGPNEIEKQDLYTMTDHTTQTAAITKVTIFCDVNSAACHGDTWAATMIKTGGSEFQGDNVVPSCEQWILISTDYLVNPDTTIAWTWGDIDALQGGCKLHTTNIGEKAIHLTQTYIVVYYEIPDVNAEVRTAQEYAVVDYDEEVEYTLNRPEQVSVNHTQNLKMLNFWSGRRAVYGLTRSKRSMVLTGTQYGEYAESDINYVREMGEAGDVVTLSGVGSTQFDKDFRIISFGWKKITTKPLRYDWILELEYA